MCLKNEIEEIIKYILAQAPFNLKILDAKILKTFYLYIPTIHVELIVLLLELLLSVLLSYYIVTIVINLIVVIITHSPVSRQ